MSSHRATYRIIERADGRFDIEVTGVKGFTVQRQGFSSLRDADAALQELRSALAAYAFQLVHEGGPAFA